MLNTEIQHNQIQPKQLPCIRWKPKGNTNYNKTMNLDPSNYTGTIKMVAQTFPTCVTRRRDIRSFSYQVLCKLNLSI